MPLSQPIIMEVLVNKKNANIVINEGEGILPMENSPILSVDFSEILEKKGM